MTPTADEDQLPPQSLVERQSRMPTAMPPAAVIDAIPSYIRARSAVTARFARAGTATQLIDALETGGMRLRMPNSDAGCDAVLINTAGGMTGGDVLRLSCVLDRRAKVRITTQSAEKVYRAEHAPCEVSAHFSVASGAALQWVPQESILFDGARLARALSVDMAADARLIILEMTVLGRVARNERIVSGLFHDRWRIRRGGALVFSEDVRLEGDIGDIMQSAASAAGASAIATLLYVARDAEAKLRAVRASLARAGSECGASAWNGLLVARFVSNAPHVLRQDTANALQRLTRCKPPRIWSM